MIRLGRKALAIEWAAARAVLLTLCAAALATGAWAQVGTRPSTIEQFLAPDGPVRVVAHRGFSARAPENTMAAVRAAAAVGADMAEVDLSMTAEGTVVLLHDDKVQRTSDGRGRIVGLHLQEVQALDAGSWFSAEFAGEPIPTLGSVLDEAKGTILLNLEIKPETVEQGIVAKVIEAVRERGMADFVIVSSFSPRALEEMHQLAPEIRTAVLYKPKYWSTRDPAAMIRAVGASAFHVNRRRLTRSIEERCAEQGIPLGVYTANSPRQMKRLLERSVHAIFTDHPDVLLEEIEKTRTVNDSSDAGADPSASKAQG